MTLAARILLLGISSVTLWSWGVRAQSPRSSTPPSSASTSPTPEQTPANPNQAGTSKPNSEQTTNPSSTSAKPKSAAGKRSRQRKQVAPSSCDPAPAGSTPAGSTPAGSTPQTTAPAAANAADAAQKPCPPSKIVVRQGGISEQGIQLAGGSGGDDASQKRDAANRMLASTEENLKKIAGRQLSTAQQDSALQIRQFVNQSKSALAAGDLERAQTLAWKAKLLSDDLVNPGN